MDMTNLMFSLLFGTIGMGMFMYGKKAGRLVPLGSGAGLMVIPYFISSWIVLLLVCTCLTAAPLVVKE
jgi:hypothetical protein